MGPSGGWPGSIYTDSLLAPLGLLPLIGSASEFSIYFNVALINLNHSKYSVLVLEKYDLLI